jgi:hypothetical protein
VAATGDGPIEWSGEYQALERQVALVGMVSSLLVLLTIYFMTAQTGA